MASASRWAWARTVRAARALTGLSSVYTRRLSGLSSLSIVPWFGFRRGAGAIMLSGACRCRRVGRCGTDGPGLKLRPSASVGNATSVKASRGAAGAGIRPPESEAACKLPRRSPAPRGARPADVCGPRPSPSLRQPPIAPLALRPPAYPPLLTLTPPRTPNHELTSSPPPYPTPRLPPL